MKTAIRILIVIVVLGVIGYPVLYYTSTDEVTITVTEKERVVKGSGDGVESKYMIFTEDEVFENTDDLFFLKFKSSDLNKDLKVDSTYNVKVVGWRIGFLSSYRNIVKVLE